MGNLIKFLHAEIIRETNTISTKVFTKLTKFPVHWSSKISTNKYINNTFFRFNEEKEELLIPTWLFNETKLIVTILLKSLVSVS